MVKRGPNPHGGQYRGRGGRGMPSTRGGTVSIGSSGPKKESAAKPKKEISSAAPILVPDAEGEKDDFDQKVSDVKIPSVDVFSSEFTNELLEGLNAESAHPSQVNWEVPPEFKDTGRDEQHDITVVHSHLPEASGPGYPDLADMLADAERIFTENSLMFHPDFSDELSRLYLTSGMTERDIAMYAKGAKRELGISAAKQIEELLNQLKGEVSKITALSVKTENSAKLVQESADKLTKARFPLPVDSSKKGKGKAVVSPPKEEPLPSEEPDSDEWWMSPAEIKDFFEKMGMPGIEEIPHYSDLFNAVFSRENVEEVLGMPLSEEDKATIVDEILADMGKQDSIWASEEFAASSSTMS